MPAFAGFGPGGDRARARSSAASRRVQTTSSPGRGQTAAMTTPRSSRSSPARKPRPKPPPTQQRSTQRVSSVGSSSGSSGSPKRSSPPPKPKPKPKPPPSKKDFLSGDTSYQNVIRQQGSALNDFLADLNRRRSESKTEFSDVQRTMEQEKERALEALEQEFAARGLLKSGLFGEEQSDYTQDWGRQMEGLERNQQSLLQDLLSQKTNFKRQQEQSQEAARQDAIRRRAQKYGLG